MTTSLSLYLHPSVNPLHPQHGPASPEREENQVGKKEGCKKESEEKRRQKREERGKMEGKRRKQLKERKYEREGNQAFSHYKFGFQLPFSLSLYLTFSLPPFPFPFRAPFHPCSLSLPFLPTYLYFTFTFFPLTFTSPSLLPHLIIFPSSLILFRGGGGKATLNTP